VACHGAGDHGRRLTGLSGGEFLSIVAGMSDDEGTPFDETMIDSVDQWSRLVFEALKDWPLAKAGRWTQWEDWLMLLIPAPAGAWFSTIDVDTMEGGVKVDTGYWGCPMTPIAAPMEEAAPEMAEQARELVESWLDGRLRMAVFTNADGKWCGHKFVHGAEIGDQLDPASIGHPEAVEAEVRSSRHAGWRRYAVAGGEVVEIG
jgi:hypothetical protein